MHLMSRRDLCAGKHVFDMQARKLQYGNFVKSNSSGFAFPMRMRRCTGHVFSSQKLFPDVLDELFALLNCNFIYCRLMDFIIIYKNSRECFDRLKKALSSNVDKGRVCLPMIPGMEIRMCAFNFVKRKKYMSVSFNIQQRIPKFREE